jgi:hypothetical protein
MSLKGLDSSLHSDDSNNTTVTNSTSDGRWQKINELTLKKGNYYSIRIGNEVYYLGKLLNNGGYLNKDYTIGDSYRFECPDARGLFRSKSYHELNKYITYFIGLHEVLATADFMGNKNIEEDTKYKECVDKAIAKETDNIIAYEKMNQLTRAKQILKLSKDNKYAVFREEDEKKKCNDMTELLNYLKGDDVMGGNVGDGYKLLIKQLLKDCDKQLLEDIKSDTEAEISSVGGKKSKKQRNQKNKTKKAKRSKSRKLRK